MTEPTFSLLPEAQIITLQGPDCAAFCQAQFANDVLSLAVGHWQWSAWLTPKGRVIAIFLLARSSEQDITLMFPDGDAGAIAEQLRRFVFRRKVRIEARADLAVYGRLAPAPNNGNRLTIEPDHLLFDLGASGVARTLCVQPATSQAPDTADFTQEWRKLDLRMGLPRLDASQREQWTPQQIGLDRLGAYSVKKGCYPGQEIVARTHFLGKAKRSTRLLEVTVDAQPGDEVRRDDQVIGSVASVASGLALAVLPLDSAEEGLTVRGEPAHAVAFLEGLARS
jgi:folate-binding protein YgfZ